MNEIKDRILKLMGERGLTQEAFAKLINYSQSSISLFLSGKRPPTFSFISRTAKFFNVPPEQIQYGVGGKDADQIPIKPKIVPFVYWEDFKTSAEDILSSIDQLLLTRISKMEVLEMYISDKDSISHRVAGLRAKHIEAMSPAFPHEEAISENDLLIIDFDQKAESGDIVLAYHQNSPLIRQYIEEGGKHFLKSLHPQFPLVEIEYEDILAVEIMRVKNKRKR